MDDVRVIEVKEHVFASNARNANDVRARCKEQGLLLINLMSCPGAGKTTLLSATIDALGDELAFGIIEADVDSAVDAQTVREHGAQAVQVHTGGMCHLDAGMCDQGLAELDCNTLDIAVIENVGNLICPAEFDTGASAKVMILSTPEGHDKPLKYPLMFSVCDLVVINKIDVLPYFDFDMDKCRQYIKMRNPAAEVIPICAKSGEGIDALAGWVLRELENWKH